MALGQARPLLLVEVVAVVESVVEPNDRVVKDEPARWVDFPPSFLSLIVVVLVVLDVVFVVV